MDVDNIITNKHVHFHTDRNTGAQEHASYACAYIGIKIY